MKGIISMLFGRGEAEYREEHKAFRDAIPDDFPTHYTEEQRAAMHPACSGKHKDTMVAADYRRANQMRGPLSKSEDKRFTQYQHLTAEYQRQVASLPSGSRVVPFDEWLELQKG